MIGTATKAIHKENYEEIVYLLIQIK